jgi:putative redox protein
MTAEIVYEGNLLSRCTHLESGTVIHTDAPKDNHGNGSAFSPTDLVATALASCIITTMGIKCRQLGINVDGTRLEVQKVMASDPRRISQINVTLHMPAVFYSDKERKILEHTALTCPVAVSLHPDLVKSITFLWQEKNDQ